MFANVIHIADGVLLLVGLGAFAGACWFAAASFFEKEGRAFRVALLLAVLGPLPYMAPVFLSYPYQPIVAFALLAATGIVGLLLVIPSRGKLSAQENVPPQRFDERDLVFVRRKLVPGSELFETYYRDHPAMREMDDKCRAAPGLLSPKSAFYDRLPFTAVRGSLNAIYALLKERDGASVPSKVDVAPEEMSRFIRGWCLHFGAHSAGITHLQDYHLYSHGGYGDNYGKPVERDHEFAIAFTVEMDHELTRCAPAAPIWVEAAKQYEVSANIAIQLAILIRHLGFPARAHVFDNYQLVAPLVARDAGLGEIGRAGMLMTPRLGPRVRIAVVTTNLPLLADARPTESSVVDFCSQCVKCAENCPAQAISLDDRTIINGVKRWAFEPERCYLYWCKSGAPCGRCMAVCPHSHPDAPLHRLVRRLIARSRFVQKVAIRFDDLLYGRNPSSVTPPRWLK